VSDTDIALVHRVDQIGVEALGAPGVAVPTTRLLQALSLEVSPAFEINVFGPSGQKADTLAIMNKEWAAGDVSGTPTYDELIYPFASVLGNAVVDTPPGGTVARRWLFAPRPVARDLCRTFTHQKGRPGGNDATRSTGLIFTAFGFSLSKSGGTSLSGSVIGTAQLQEQTLDGSEVQTVAETGGPTGGTFALAFMGATTGPIPYNATASQLQTALEALAPVDPGDVLVAGGPLPATALTVRFGGALTGVDPTAITIDSSALTGGTSPAVTATTTTPYAPATATPLVPLAPGQVDVYLDDDFASLGTHKLLRDFVVEHSFGNRRNPIWPLNSALASFDGTVETKPDPTLSLKLGNNPEARALFATIRSGGRKYVRVEATGPIIEAAIAYRFRFDACVIIGDAPSPDDEDGLSTMTIPFRCVYDATNGLWFSAELINTMVAL
jgi:hypothetical protein